MSNGSRELVFHTTGAFITDLARDWFWEEKKPWPVIEELLLACMCGTDKPKEELVKLAREIVCGSKQFIGRTDDGSYAMVDDDKELLAKYQASWAGRLKSTEAALNEIEQKFFQLADYLIDSGYGRLLRMSGVSGEEDEPDMSDELKSYLEQSTLEKRGFEDNYGWLDPGGSFYPVDWGEHQGWAYRKARQMGWIQDSALHTGQDGDILVQHGWVLLHSPSMGVASVTASDEKPLTKAQREFMFSYYSDRGKPELARKYFLDA